MRTLIFLCFLTTTQAKAQQTYILEEDYRLSTYNSQGLLTSTIELTDTLGIADIAVSPDGKLYGINNLHLFEVDPLTGNFSNYVAMPDLGNLAFWNSLVCSNDYNLYTVDNIEYGLYKYSILEDTLMKIADFGFSSSGDLTIYKGNLILSTFDFDDFKNKLVSYNLQSGEINRVFCIPGNLAFFGLTNLISDCNGEIILGGESDGVVYEIDIENGVLSESDTEYGDAKIWGLASDVEHLASNCNQELLDIDCNLVDVENNNPSINNIVLFPNPTNDYLNIESSFRVNQINLYNMLGVLVKSEQVDTRKINLAGLESGLYLVIMDTEIGRNIQTIKKVK